VIRLLHIDVDADLFELLLNYFRPSDVVGDVASISIVSPL
jgi:hypothetical protein